MSFKFPWGTNQSSSAKHEASITDVLPTPVLRTDLVLLVVLCTDLMRDELTSVFGTGNNSTLTQLSQSPSALFRGQEDGISPSRNTGTAAPSSTIPRSLRDAELSSGRMQGLKRASVTFFNAWRTKVLRRMGTVLSVQPDAIKMAKAKYLANREAAEKARRDKEYFDWANGEDLEQQQKPTPEKINTSLNHMEHNKRALILNCCLMLLLSLEQYSAHSRILLERMASHLDLPDETLPLAESAVAQGLLESAAASSIDADEVAKKKASEDATARRWKVGLATVAGAAVVGVTGGLAAPFLLAGAGAIMGGVGLGSLASLLGALVGNPVVIGALFGAMGGKITGKAMDEYAKEVKDFKLIPLDEDPPTYPNPTNEPSSLPSAPNPTRKLRLSIGISGYLLQSDNIFRPWRVFSPTHVSPFALRYDPPVLLRLGRTIDTILRDSAYSLAQASFLQVALPAVISSALLPLSLMKLGKTIDNPFSVAMERSDKAGRVLAAALMAKVQGERPVSLVGYSLGARVIYVCLQELAAKQAFGLVESAVLMGAPAPSDEIAWRRIRTVVVGRVVNVYTTNDLLLGFLYRSTKAQVGVAGLQAIGEVPNTDNLDATDFVKGHHQWRWAVGRVLRELKWKDLDQTAVEDEEEELRQVDEQEKAAYRHAKEEGKLVDAEDESGTIVMMDAEEAEKKLEGEKRSSDRKAEKQSVSSVGKGIEHMDLSDESEHRSTKIEMKNDLSDSDEDEGDQREPLAMAHLDPEPESEPDPKIQADPGPRRETVRLGGDGSGAHLDVVWDRG